MLEYKGLKIGWLGHDCFKIRDHVTIYTDPFKIRGGEKADIILITHEHFDHLSIDDIKKIATPNTVAIAPSICERELRNIRLKDVKILDIGESTEVSDVKIQAVAAYNTSKFRAPGMVFHPKEDGRIGFIIEIEGVRLYHAGDTDQIPEMKGLNVDIAFLPVSGTYVMTAEEAARAVEDINPKVAIPMHYGSIVGDKSDAIRFKDLVKCEVHILEKE